MKKAEEALSEYFTPLVNVYVGPSQPWQGPKDPGRMEGLKKSLLLRGKAQEEMAKPSLLVHMWMLTAYAKISTIAFFLLDVYSLKTAPLLRLRAYGD